MASTITVTVTLGQGEINKAAQQIVKTFDAAFDQINKRAQQVAQQFNQAFGSGQANQQFNALRNNLNQVGQSLTRAGVALSGFSVGLGFLGRAAVKSAIDIDAGVNVLRAFTGSAEKAEKRLAQLIATAQKTPGLTTNLALTLDAQLRAARVAESTIDRILPAIGRINAVRRLEDPGRFVNNLIQLVTQGFERADLKELVGASPIAGNLIRQLFNVDSPTNAKAIREAARRMGITTVDEFVKRFSEAAQNSPELQRAQESLGTQFDKLRVRAIVALRPLGLAIIETLGPLITTAVPIIEDLGRSFKGLDPSTRQAVVGIGAITLAVGPLLIGLSSTIQALGTIGRLLVTVAGAAARTATALNLVGRAGAIGAAVAVVAGGGVPGFRRPASVDQFEAFAQARLRAQQGRTPTLGPNNEPFGPPVAEADLARIRQQQALQAEIDRLQKGLAAGLPSDKQRGGGRDAVLEAQIERAEEAIRVAKVLRPEFAALTEELNKLTNRFLEVGGVFTAEIQELPLEKRIAFLAARIADAEDRTKRLKDAARGIIDLPAVKEFKGPLPLPEGFRLGGITPEGFKPGDGIPGGPPPATPRFLEDLKRKAAEIPPIPRLIAEEFDNAARFAKGFSSQIETMGSIFDRFGASVSRSLLNVQGLFRGIGQAFKNLFLDIVGSGLQQLVGSVLGITTGGRVGPGGTPGINPNASGGRGGGATGNIFSQVASSIGNLFRTPGFNPNAGGAAPAALSGGLVPLSDITPAQLGGLSTDTALARAAGATALQGIFGGIGFGKAAGSGGALAGLLPFLGVSLGSGLGGTSTLGKILGGIGGGLLGVGLTAAPAILGAGGALAGSLGFLAPLFSNPITAAIGAALLPAAFLLGRAKQRRADERTSGDSLQQAINSIFALREAARAGELTSILDAEQQFSAIHGQFVQETLQLKTRSVRESRLANQADITPPLHKDSIRLLFEREVLPAVQTARRNQQTHQLLIPEFATGGVFRGAGLAVLHDGEVILNHAQQRRVQSLAGPDVFARAGVPSFETGGVFSSRNQETARPVIVFENVTLAVGESDATGILGVALRTADGKRHVYGTVKDARRDNF